MPCSRAKWHYSGTVTSVKSHPKRLGMAALYCSHNINLISFKHDFVANWNLFAINPIMSITVMESDQSKLLCLFLRKGIYATLGSICTHSWLLKLKVNPPPFSKDTSITVKALSTCSYFLLSLWWSLSDHSANQMQDSLPNRLSVPNASMNQTLNLQFFPVIILDLYW